MADRRSKNSKHYRDPVKVARLNADRWRRSERSVCAQLVKACFGIAQIANFMNVTTRGKTLDQIVDECCALALKKWRPVTAGPLPMPHRHRSRT